jgi:redox-sensing transcriptional repressor
MTARLGGDQDGRKVASIPEAAVARLAVYLRVLAGLAEAERGTVSSDELAAAAGVNSAKLRKDLSYVGSYGTRGVGYEVAVLVCQIERLLGLTREHSVAIVGVGNLGRALANYGGFPGRGFPVTALFDVDPELVGTLLGGVAVDHAENIPGVCAARGVTVGVIATPLSAAQAATDRLVAAGVACILNFAPVILRAPDHVEVRKVDLAAEMQILSFHNSRRPGVTDGAAAAVVAAGGSSQQDTAQRSGTDGMVRPG